MERINNYQDFYNSLFFIIVIIFIFVTITFITHRFSKNKYNKSSVQEKIIKNISNQTYFKNKNIQYISSSFLVKLFYKEILIEILNNYVNQIGIKFNFNITLESLNHNLTYTKENLPEMKYQLINHYFNQIYQQNFPNPYYSNLSDLQLMFFIYIIKKSLIPSKLLSNHRPFFKSSCLFPENKKLLLTNQKIYKPININNIFNNHLIIIDRNNQVIPFNQIIPKASKTLIILGSYTCPHWRYFAPKIILFCQQHNFSFFFIYTQEAHSNLWIQDQNLKININYQHPKTILQKLFLADQAYDYLLKKTNNSNSFYPNNVNLYIDPINNNLDQIFLSGGLFRIFLLKDNYLVWNSIPFQFSLSQLYSQIK